MIRTIALIVGPLTLAAVCMGVFGPHDPSRAPTVETACINGHVWTIHYFKAMRQQDFMILVDGSPVECEAK